MAQKRKQAEQEREQLGSKRMKANKPSHQRAQHNQLMAEAAIARISAAKQENNSVQSQTSTDEDKEPTKSELKVEPDQTKDYKVEIEKLNKTISTYRSVLESQTNLIDSIKSSLSCNICFEIIDSPYALLCGHIFCHKDLYAWLHRSSSFSSQQQDLHHHPTIDHHSSDSERFESALSQTINPGGTRTTANRNSAEQATLRQANSTEQLGQRTIIPDEITNNDNGSQPALRPDRWQTISPRRRRQNLICPQCRAPVIGRPINLYAIKEITSKLKSSEPPTCASSTSATAPTPSSSNSNSFRNLVELYRDEKDLTWGNLFNHPTSNSTNLTQDVAQRFILDTEDRVRRCGRCSWEIGPDGLCAGCGTAYLDFVEDLSSSSDSSFQIHSEESRYVGTDSSEGDLEDLEDLEEESADEEPTDPVRSSRAEQHGRFIEQGAVSSDGDEEGSDEEPSSARELRRGNERSSSSFSRSSHESRDIRLGGHIRRNVIRVSSESEDEDYRFGPQSVDHQSSTPDSNSSVSVHSRRPGAIHYNRTDYASSSRGGSQRSEPDGDPWTSSSSDRDDHPVNGRGVIIREVVHYDPGSEGSFGTPQSSDDCDRWSGHYGVSSHHDAYDDQSSDKLENYSDNDVLHDRAVDYSSLDDRSNSEDFSSDGYDD